MPYVTLSVIYVLIYCILWLFNIRDSAKDTVIKSIYLTVSGLGIGTLWFLPTLFGAVCCFILTKKYVKRGREFLSFLLIPELVVCQILNSKEVVGTLHKDFVGLLCNELSLLFQIMIATSLMAIGLLLWDFMELLKCMKHRAIVIPIFSMAAGFINFAFCALYSGNDLHYAKIINAVGYLICIPFGTFFIMGLSVIMNKISILRKVLTFCGRNSIIIMTTHLEYKIVALSQLMVGKTFSSILMRKTFCFVLLFLIECLICYIVNNSFFKRVFYWRRKKERKIIDDGIEWLCVITPIV